MAWGGGPGGPDGPGGEGCCLGLATCCGPGLLLTGPGMLLMAVRHPVRAARRLSTEMDPARDVDRGGR
jgi:hypothetical protein